MAYGRARTVRCRWPARLSAKAKRITATEPSQRGISQLVTMSNSRVFSGIGVYAYASLSATADQFFEPQPGLNAGTLSSGRTIVATFTAEAAANLLLTSSSSSRDQPTLLTSIFPSGPTRNKVGTFVSP
jgi:hypothetical protein